MSTQKTRVHPLYEANTNKYSILFKINISQRQSFSKMSMGMSLQMPTFAQCGVLGATTLPYRSKSLCVCVWF